jgi:membrane protein DedA with SNARE-associated domain
VGKLLIVLHTIVAIIKTGQMPQLGYWIYVLLAMLVAIEGPIATLLGAVAASAGLMRAWLVFVAAATGNLTADSLWYSLGYLGKMEWILRFGNRLELRKSLLNHLKQKMLDHATKVLFLAKLTVSFVIPSSIIAGFLRIPWRRWFPALMVAETLWTGSLVLIGYYTTEAVKRVEQGVEYVMLSVSIVFVVFVMLAGRRLIKQWNQETTESIPPQRNNEEITG